MKSSKAGTGGVVKGSRPPPQEYIEINQYKKNYALVQSEEETKEIRQRIEKHPKAYNSIENYDSMFKVVLIGDSSTGKTSMLLRFSENIFNEHYICTIGVDFKIKTLVVDGFKNVKL